MALYAQYTLPGALQGHAAFLIPTPHTPSQNKCNVDSLDKWMMQNFQSKKLREKEKNVGRISCQINYCVNSKLSIEMKCEQAAHLSGLCG